LISGANTHDMRLFTPLLRAVLPIKRPLGRPRQRPAKLHADKGYDYPACRAELRRRGIACRIARKGIESSERLGRYRWVVERTFAWRQTYRRLLVRYERSAALHLALLQLACSLICLRFLPRRFCKG
jgi:transposase